MKIKVIFASLLILTGAVHAQNTAPAVDLTPYQSCISQLRSSGLFTGINAASWAQAAPQLQADGSVLPLLDKQPEFTMPETN